MNTVETGPGSTKHKTKPSDFKKPVTSWHDTFIDGGLAGSLLLLWREISDLDPKDSIDRKMKFIELVETKLANQTHLSADLGQKVEIILKELQSNGDVETGDGAASVPVEVSDKSE